VSRTDAITLAYLVTIICFILALRFLSNPARARQGNWVGAFGMAVAIVATFFRPGLENIGWILLVIMRGNNWRELEAETSAEADDGEVAAA